MKKTLLLTAAASALILSACAGVQTSQSGATSATLAAGQGSMYCWKRSLSESGDALLCNWAGSKNDACLMNGINANPLAKNSVATGPKDAGRCENGEWLVMVNTK